VRDCKHLSVAGSSTVQFFKEDEKIALRSDNSVSDKISKVFGSDKSTILHQIGLRKELVRILIPSKAFIQHLL
jgi:hypothetical protein